MHVSTLILQKEHTEIIVVLQVKMLKGLNALLQVTLRVTCLNHHLFFRETFAENNFKQVCIVHEQAHTLHELIFYLLHVS